jgi:eukaryotic-like serine/threonine-protein kinase
MKQCPTCGVRFYERTTRCPIDATPLIELPDPLIGRLIQERYLVEQLLGSGGMGSVYRGRHQVINRQVALKFLAHKHARDDNSRQRFLREARAVNRVQHEHIIDVSDFGETTDGLVYMVMEFLSGRTLSDDIAAGAMPIARACGIGVQLAFALARAHELGVIHRDIKPANVFLIRKGQDNDFVKLLDFGLARANDDIALTKSNLLFGTPEYMAPEQASSEPVGAKADLYAFGCVLFEMTTGRLPFEGAPTGLIYKHVYEPPPRPTALRPELPPALEALILRLLHKAPERRPANAYEVADELTRIAAALPESAAQTSVRPGVRVSAEPDTTAIRNEEDRWQDNLGALQARVDARYRNAEPPASVKGAMQRVAALVGDAHTLRKSLSDVSLGAAEQHDATRGTKLRIGAAIDALALDESRVAQEILLLEGEHKRALEQLERAVRQLLPALDSLDTAARDPLGESSTWLPLLQGWLQAQKRALALYDRLTEQEIARTDLRFQISHLKGRFASLGAASSVELEPVEAKAAELQAQLGAKLSAIRSEAGRITAQLEERT